MRYYSLHLLLLPVEIRNKIYDHVLGPLQYFIGIDEGIGHWYTRCLTPLSSLDLSVLGVCHQLHDEATKYLYSRLALEVVPQNGRSLLQFLDQIGARNAEHIRTLVMSTYTLKSDISFEGWQSILLGPDAALPAVDDFRLRILLRPAKQDIHKLPEQLHRWGKHILQKYRNVAAFVKSIKDSDDISGRKIRTSYSTGCFEHGPCSVGPCGECCRGLSFHVDDELDRFGADNVLALA